MAETAGTDTVIQGMTAPMVAVPGPGQALLARSAGYGGTLPALSVEGWNLMLGPRPADTALNLLLSATLPRALHSANAWPRRF